MFEGMGDDKRLRMANLAIIGSHAVNGVSALHTDLLKANVFPEFNEYYPGKFSNKTNGITPRRWLKKSNPELSKLITDTIGDSWVGHLPDLEKLLPHAEDAEFRKKWMLAKRANKERMAAHIFKEHGVKVSVDAMFDGHVKRIHEYKRQLLNVMHVITLYNRIKDAPRGNYTPRVVLFGGKAAPGYFMAKLNIKLINAVADVVNKDPVVGDRLKVFFLADYRVSLAEKIIPAADLSEQISTAGKEASGTGNMKFSLNGALTIGTLDGANIEIKDCVGDDNIFIFGLKAHEIAEMQAKGYNPMQYYETQPDLKRVIDMIGNGHFCPDDPELFKPIVDSWLLGGDTYFLLADYASYIASQDRVAEAYRDQERWARMSIANVAKMGPFSSDETIRRYAKEIWGYKI
jgi:glycogen phosphorylase